MVFVCRIQSVRRVLEVIVFVAFFVKILYQPPDSKQDEAEGNQESSPYRKGL